MKGGASHQSEAVPAFTDEFPVAVGAFIRILQMFLLFTKKRIIIYDCHPGSMNNGCCPSAGSCGWGHYSESRCLYEECPGKTVIKHDGDQIVYSRDERSGGNGWIDAELPEHHGNRRADHS